VELIVSWLYRAEIKSPPDTISELAKEAGCSASEVRTGIAEAKHLLDQVQPALDAGVITQADLEDDLKRRLARRNPLITRGRES
jgi:hypothetical protein